MTTLTKLEEAGLTVKESKCEIDMDSVQYLGYKVSREGLTPLPDKLKPILEAPAPTNVAEVKSFLGMITYYVRFLPNISTIMEPIHELTRTGVAWNWSKECQDAFEYSKNMLASARVLVHYDVNKPLVLSVDASPYGIGAVLSHMIGDQEKPICFASRKLTTSERRYSQLDKEGLAVVYGVTKFQKYLEGRSFTIYTDHRPLLGLLGSDKPIPNLSSPRVQRWAIMLAGYDYELCFRRGEDNGNADCMSRLPLPQTISESSVIVPGSTVLTLQQLDTTTITAKCVRNWTARDPVLSQVVRLLLEGWPDSFKPDELMTYYSHRSELSLQDGIILWGQRVIIPEPGRAAMLEELHDTHPGVSRMKALARSYVFWPGIDNDIEAKVKNCEICQRNRKNPPPTPLHPWDWPDKPWSRVHADFAGEFMGYMFLILIDAHSKWMDVHVMQKITAEATRAKMHMTFANQGFPEVLVTDNGPTFTSKEFREFIQAAGIRHIFSPPYHPSSNGLAERAVQIFKQGMKSLSVGTIQNKVSRFCFGTVSHRKRQLGEHCVSC